MTDHEQLETMLRSSLTERAGDVDTTPALYERVQRQATRGTWLRRGVALAGAAAAVAVAVTVVPALVPDQPLRPDVAETPDLIEPTEPAEPSVDPTVEPSEDAAPGVAVTALQQANVAFADDTGRVTVGQRTVAGPASVVSLAVSPFWTATDGAVAAGLEDGRIGVVDQRSNGGDNFDVLVDASTNGGGVAFSPDGGAIGWIEGTDLHVLPLASELDGERVLPLEGDVPDDLRIQQWFYASDAQVILASDPAGGIWSIPMDDSDSYNSAPTNPAFQQNTMPGAADAALLPDLNRVVVAPVGVADYVALQLQIGEVYVGAPEELVDARAVDLTTDGSGSVVLHDPTTGIGVRFDGLAGEAYEVEATWQVPGTTAVVPLPSNPNGTNDPVEEAGTDAAALGLPTDAPVVGTAGTDLLVRTADGQVQTIPVYEQPSEATLGRLAVRPGSTIDAGLIAVESFSEGENSIRFVALRDGGATPVGEVLVTDGAVTGLVWSEDGAHLAWTDDTGMSVVDVVEDGQLDGPPRVINENSPTPVVDWTWEEVGDTATGRLTTTGVGAIATMVFEISRAADGTLSEAVTTIDGGVPLVLDVHATPNVAGGPQVVARRSGDTAELFWVDGDDSGRLPDPGVVGDPEDPNVSVDASGGQVLVLGSSRQVMVTFDGDVLDLPTAADWDVLD